jgi:hypothetical protein
MEQQITLTENSQFKLYNHEANQSLKALDINRLSGSVFEDSLLQVFLATIRAGYGNFSNEFIPIGFKITSYSSSEITVGKGILIAPDGVYRFEGAVLTPSPTAWWGAYEFELVKETASPVSKVFKRPNANGVMFGSGDSRSVFKLKLYENFNSTQEFPSIPSGRIRLLQYKKASATSGATIIQASNSLSKQSPKNTFTPGDIKQSLSPGDGEEWLTVLGQTIPSRFTDLIDAMRSIRINQNSISYNVTNPGIAGRTRLTFSALSGIKGILTYPDVRAMSATIKSATVPVLPLGVYRILAITTTSIDIELPFNNGMTGGIGDLDITPFAIPDLDGGGAKLPLPSYLKVYTGNDPNDLNRIPLTYQANQFGAHVHGVGTMNITGQGTKPVNITGSSGNDSPDHGHSTGGGGGSHSHGHGYNHGWANPFGGGSGMMMGNIDVVGNGVNSADINHTHSVGGANTRHTHPVTGSGTIDISGFGLAGSSASTGGTDTDNPNVTRPDNLSVYLLVKT